jgi:hypothetical protein
MRRSIPRSLVVPLVSAAMLAMSPGPAEAGGSWFSKVRQVPRSSLDPGLAAPAEAGDSGVSVFDLVISLYRDPSGDDDPDNDTGAEDQTAYEDIVRFWADAVCEQSNGAQQLGRIRFFRNGAQSSLADVVWNASEWPQANVGGFGRFGANILFGDVFPGAFADGSDLDFLGTAARQEDAGYTLGHEFGHYIYGLYDEYVGSNAAEARINFPQTGDTAVTPSIMNNQFNARGGNFEWLNHSTQDNFEAFHLREGGRQEAAPIRFAPPLPDEEGAHGGPPRQEEPCPLPKFGPKTGMEGPCRAAGRGPQEGRGGGEADRQKQEGHPSCSAREGPGGSNRDAGRLL